MRLAIEIVRAQHFERLVDSLVLEQNCAEHRLLGFEVLGRNAPEDLSRRNRH